MSKTNLPEKPHEYCGLAGSFAAPGLNVTNVVVEMGKALQHRGQNGGGVAVKPIGKMLKIYKRALAFNEIFRSVDVVDEHALRGEIAIAHLRYPTEGASRENCDAQPFHVRYKGWELALGHNGSIVDVAKHRAKLKKFGIKPESDSDSEILAWLIATAQGSTWKLKISNALAEVKGAYSLVMVTGDDKLMALRDPWGVRPLVWTQDNGHVFVASETCALDRISIRHHEKLKRANLLIADENGVTISDYTTAQKPSFCVFEKLYFSNETSIWDGVIGKNREELGEQLALEELASIRPKKERHLDIKQIDYVVAVPDTARPGAFAFFETIKRKLPKSSKLKYFRGLVKERYDYARRTFIEDDPYLRTKHIEKKFFVSPAIIGKNIYLVDDTAVRLNTFKILVEHLKNIGVREIHCRFLAPKFLNPCFLGVNIGSRNELGAVQKENGRFFAKSENQIKKELGVASLRYLSLEGLAKSLDMSTDEMHKSHCTGCLDYNYPFDMRPYDAAYKKVDFIKPTKHLKIKDILNFPQNLS
ncbi:class II glutamine amidotransferase [Candidatus Curtissbacteria bacterium]|nr:class II glutamine amidotransferase [Candidatus Curtissbacteria bacterium]